MNRPVIEPRDTYGPQAQNSNLYVIHDQHSHEFSRKFIISFQSPWPQCGMALRYIGILIAAKLKICINKDYINCCHNFWFPSQNFPFLHTSQRWRCGLPIQHHLCTYQALFCYKHEPQVKRLIRFTLKHGECYLVTHNGEHIEQAVPNPVCTSLNL